MGKDETWRRRLPVPVTGGRALTVQHHRDARPAPSAAAGPPPALLEPLRPAARAFAEADRAYRSAASGHSERAGRVDFEV